MSIAHNDIATTFTDAKGYATNEVRNSLGELMKSIVVFIFLAALVADSQATTYAFGVSNEESCACLDKYARVEFEVIEGRLVNIDVIDGTRQPKCDELLLRYLKKVVGASSYPNGTRVVMVIGTSSVDVSADYDQCLMSKEFEKVIHQHVEKVTIDIEKANQRCNSNGPGYSLGQHPTTGVPKELCGMPVTPCGMRVTP